jgi:hypothetical protein
MLGDYQAIGVCVGHGPQEKRVYDTEDRGVGANPQGESDDRNRRESRTPGQRTEGKAQITADGSHGR